MNKHRHITLATFLGISLIVLLVSLFWFLATQSDGDHVAGEKLMVGGSEAAVAAGRESGLVADARALNGSRDVEPHVGPKKRSPGEVYAEATRLFTSNEAQRCELISVERHGSEMWYLLHVEAPDQAEIAGARQWLADAQSQVEEKHRQSLDGLLGRLIDSYDPFGRNGERAMLIVVPDDPETKIVGHVFDSEGREGDKAKFDPSRPDDHTFRNSRMYMSTENEIPVRFQALLTLPSRDE